MGLKMIDYANDQRGMMTMVYGPPGVGKSTLAARIAGLSDGVGVALDFEVGMQEALREVGKDTKLFDLSEPSGTMGGDVVEFLKQLRNKKEVKRVSHIRFQVGASHCITTRHSSCRHHRCAVTCSAHVNGTSVTS